MGQFIIIAVVIFMSMGFFIMMLLGLVMSEQKHQLLANKSTSQKQPE